MCIWPLGTCIFIIPSKRCIIDSRDVFNVVVADVEHAPLVPHSSSPKLSASEDN